MQTRGEQRPFTDIAVDLPVVVSDYFQSNRARFNGQGCAGHRLPDDSRHYFLVKCSKGVTELSFSRGVMEKWKRYVETARALRIHGSH